MSTIITRAGKGSPLTNNEMDANLTNLNTTKLETTGGTITGNVDFVSINSGQLAGFRNRITNGSMRIMQRGISFPNANGYTADRWFVNRFGGATGVAVTQGTGVFGDARAALRLQRDVGTSGTQTSSVYQPVAIADSIGLAGKAITVSLQVGTSNITSTTGHSITLYYQTTLTDQGVAGTWTSVASVPFTLTTNTAYQLKSATFSLPATATQVMIEIKFAYTGVAPADESFYITEVQLETGAAATPFEQRFVSTELALCQWYYRTQQSSSVGWCTTATKTMVAAPFPRMRITPTVALVSGTVEYGPGGSQAASSFDVPTVSADSFTVGVNVAGGLTINAGSLVRFTATLSADL